jgi:uncharacterized membrane protein
MGWRQITLKDEFPPNLTHLFRHNSAIGKPETFRAFFPSVRRKSPLMKFLIGQLKAHHRLNLLLIFAFTTILCISLVGIRVHISSHVTFMFLLWNIFLALIPYCISTLLILFGEKIKNRWIIFIPFALWLCFFPNAPYILTDLFHLKQRHGIPYWYDLALILFFAWNGLMLGYASLLDIHMIFTRHFGRLTGWVIAIASLVLGSFGIYLGRYLRWNSWDILYSPDALLLDIGDRLLHPTQHPSTYGVTIIFSLFLILGYILLFEFSRAHRHGTTPATPASQLKF